MTEYEAPKITEIGTITDLTEQNFNKNAGSSDTVTIGGVTAPIPGSGSTP